MEGESTSAKSGDSDYGSDIEGSLVDFVVPDHQPMVEDEPEEPFFGDDWFCETCGISSGMYEDGTCNCDH